MRIIRQIEDIDYSETKEFFKKRAGKFRKENPYSVTMYQDHNQELVQERNQKEISKLKPMLCLDEKSRVLDIACGIGRWADAISEKIDEYCGIDFSGELIRIAEERNTKQNFFFYEGTITDIETVLQRNAKKKYNVILLIGILMYVNDKDMGGFLGQLERQCEEHSKICIREPIGLKDRLTLKDFYSEELDDSYNAIYRTREELAGIFGKTLLEKGFSVDEEGFLFEESVLNNRKETAQYYFVLSR